MEAYKKVELAFGKATAAEYNASYHSAPLQKHWDRKFVRLLSGQVPRGSRVLDLASGPGALWPDLTARGYRVVGLDLSVHMLAEARKVRATIPVVNADAEALPFGADTFDAVICSSALHHLADAAPVVAEIARVLKPYGCLVGREPTDHQTFESGWISHAVMSLVNVVRRRHRIVDPPEPDLHEHHRTLDIEEFVRTLSEHLVVHHLTTEFPFSSLFARVPNEYHALVIRQGDRLLRRRRGAQVYYAARKHGYRTGDVVYGVRCYLQGLDKEAARPYSKTFTAFLLLATYLLDLTLPKR